MPGPAQEKAVADTGLEGAVVGFEAWDGVDLSLGFGHGLLGLGEVSLVLREEGMGRVRWGLDWTWMWMSRWLVWVLCECWRGGQLESEGGGPSKAGYQRLYMLIVTADSFSIHMS
jgi:hypothetical protein